MAIWLRVMVDDDRDGAWQPPAWDGESVGGGFSAICLDPTPENVARKMVDLGRAMENHVRMLRERGLI